MSGAPDTERRRRGRAALAGMALWAVAMACDAAMVATVRAMSAELQPFQMVFLRLLFGLAVLGPILLLSGQSLRTQRLPLHAVRSAGQLGAMLLFFYAVSLAPLADLAALSFAAPLFATLGAALLLREAVRWRRGLALAAGFAGMLLILRPGFEELRLGHLFGLASAIVWAGALLLIKRLARTESSAAMAAWSTLLITPIAAVPAILVWRWPSPEVWALAALAGLFGTLTHLCIGRAMRMADISALLPMEFLRLVWVALLAWQFFGEAPELFTWIGGAVIFASATYVGLREARLARERRPG